MERRDAPLMRGAKAHVLDAIGETPIVRLNAIPAREGLASEFYVKLESMNPGGSVKDRIGRHMLDRAREEGALAPGGVIIEATSGNTGVGLAMWAIAHGHKCIFVIPDKQSKEKIENLKAFGAKVVVCPTNVAPEDPKSYYSVSRRLHETIPGSFYVNQYDNLHNREAHYRWTGPEILRQTGGEFDAFVAAVGTGGTISGCGRRLKEEMGAVKVVGVDCEGSIIAQYARTGDATGARPYALEGVGEDFVPQNYDFGVIDDWEVVGDRESFLMTRRLLREEGIYAGGSAGAALCGAFRYARKIGEPETILVLVHDSGNRYASKIYSNEWMSDNGYLDSSLGVRVKDAVRSMGPRLPLVSAGETDTVGEAIATMEREGISQLPVLDEDGRLAGLVSERGLVRPVLMGELRREDSVALASAESARVIDEDEPLESVAHALLRKETVLVARNGRVVDILTETDMLRHLSEGRA